MATVFVKPLFIGRIVVHLRPWLDATKDRKGVSALEFAITAPVLFLVLFGIIQLGITFNNYVTLTNGVRVGSRVLAADRGSATPYTDATTAVYNSAPALTKASLTLTLTVNGAACTSDTTCQTALTAGVGNAATVQASYPCDLTIMGVNYAPGCTLTSTTTERVE
ncbi:MAG: pilus assembly protein [Rhodopila sp.]|nr:pilus assembly protein [Rhodopila sp.]